MKSWPTRSISDDKEDDDAEDAEAARTTLIAHRTLHNTVKRKRNVIITGLPESQTSVTNLSFCACVKKI